MQPIIIESPFAGKNGNIAQRALNEAYLEACKRFALLNGEIPIASHSMFTRCLDDRDPSERALGIAAGLELAKLISRVRVHRLLFGDETEPVPETFPSTIVFCVDLGWSSGMLAAKEFYQREGVPWRTRSLGPAWQTGTYPESIAAADFGGSVER